MFKWILAVCLLMVAASLVISAKVEKAAPVSAVPVQALAAVNVPAAAVNEAPAVGAEEKVGHLTKAEETLSGRVAPKYEAPLESTILPQ